ncbi:MAG TPA: hypothetical protein VFU13_14830 [Steroidobacteraceae bacterium]|nr:hypothetical protein [Steroidobacteraceae bacterium]
MTAPFEKWTVLPHGKLTRLNERIVTVIGELKMPLMKLPRRMTAVKLNSGDLAIFSAIALRDADMAELEALGRPAFLIVPSERHRLDAPAYVQRYPAITVVAPNGGKEKIGKVVRIDTSTPDFGDPSVRYVELAADSALEVDSADGLTVIVNDLIGDIHDESGIGGWLLRVMGFAGDDPQVPGPVKLLLGKHKSEVAQQFRRWAARDDLRRIVVSHGETIDADPRGVLRTLASSLD